MMREIRRGATLSPDRQYRYVLWRDWSEERRLAVVGFNPSTADELTDDQTIRRCMGYARREGLGGLLMLNLFALRSTDPKALLEHPDPVGANDGYLRDTLGNHLGPPIVLAAWGAIKHPLAEERVELVRSIVDPDRLRCIGRTATGAPRHPSRGAYRDLEPFA